MARIRHVGGTITERTGGNEIYFSEGDIVINAVGNINITSTNGVIFEEPEKPNNAKTKVKTIICKSELDNGSANDGGDSNIKKGVLHNKSYIFEVKEFTKGFPNNINSIKWALSYKNQETGDYEFNILENKSYTGISILINFSSILYCGGELVLKAYIDEDAENEGKFEFFMHYKFRWFDRKKLCDEILERQSKPFLANQANTSLCGMASIMYLLSKKNFNLYQTFIKELHRTGEFEFKNYKVNVFKKSSHLFEMNPNTNEKYPKISDKKMPYCDWISFASIRDQENNIRDFDGSDDFSFDGATFPNEIVKLMKDILEFTDVVDNTNMVFNKGTLIWDGENSSSREIARINELKNEGYEVVLLINTSMLYNKESGIISTLEHWIVFEEIIGGTINWDEYDFKVFTWGELRNVIINPKVFSSNYYGYVYGK